METIIEMNEVKKTFGNLSVLDRINLEIEKGDIYGLVGRSGAGKSTLLRCINGLETYDQGMLKVNNTEISALSKTDLRTFQKSIGMIFQNFALIERRTVYQNIALPMKVWGMNSKAIDYRVKELLELVQIPEKINEKPAVLSGGQKQRVAIARALSLNPKILLCDEATSALDPQTTQSILSLLRSINKKLGLTIIIVTHQMSVVRQVCNKVSILEHGEIAATGFVEDMFLHQPPAFRNFLGQSRIKLPNQGINIRIFLPAQVAQTSILSSIIRELDMDIPIVSGQMDTYRDEVIGNFVLNISKEKVEHLTNILNKKNVEWQLEETIITGNSEVESND
ncbi:MAG: methionine ABC transporter ATP-binding protein [Lachnospiraceae bacterium]